MPDEYLVYHKIKPGFDFKPHMKGVYVEAINNPTFNQDGNESALLKMKCYNPPDLLFQHLTIKEKVKNNDVHRMRNGYTVDVLTSVDIQEVIKNGGKAIEIYEILIYRENFKLSPFRKIIEKLFTLGQTFEDEGNALMQKIVISIINTLYGIQIHRYFSQFYKCNKQNWIETEFDDNVLDYSKSTKWKLFSKIEKKING